MKTKILALAFVLCMTLNGFAQNKKDDDNKPCTRAQLAQLIVDTLPWVKELPDVTKDQYYPIDIDPNYVNYHAIQIICKKGILDTCSMIESYKPKYPIVMYELAYYLNGVLMRTEEYYNKRLPVLLNYDPPCNISTDLKGTVINVVQKSIVSKNQFCGNYKGHKPATIKEVKLVLQRIKEKTEALLKEKEEKK